MQLYALDENKALVFANSAIRGRDYTCLECQALVRVRGGYHRQTHFYHLQLDRACRQSGKGMEHIQLQRLLYGLLPGECELERRFPEIGRIADVVWVPEKIIFEIQCSPIKAEEVRQRTRDYEALGFRVVWILHDKQFNGRRLSAAEHYLTPLPHYYTNLNKEGAGIVYDQFDVVRQGLRLWKSTCFSVDLRYPVREVHARVPALPERLMQRIKQAGLFFAGGVQEYIHTHNLFVQALEKEKSRRPRPSLWALLARPYRIFFRYLLERACR